MFSFHAGLEHATSYFNKETADISGGNQQSATYPLRGFTPEFNQLLQGQKSRTIPFPSLLTMTEPLFKFGFVVLRDKCLKIFVKEAQEGARGVEGVGLTLTQTPLMVTGRFVTTGRVV